MLFYRILLGVAAPILMGLALWRWVRKRSTLAEWCERLGGGVRTGGQTAPERDHPRLWLHGASNGELTSARGLLQELLQRAPGLRVVVTANTATARAMVEGWGLPGVEARFAPLDYRWALDRFLRRWTPDALVMLESEIWPNRFELCHRAGLPVLILGARMSERSARIWGRLPGLAARLLGQVRFLSAQDPGSATRFVELGLPPGCLGPTENLKVHAAATPRDIPSGLASAFAGERVFLAASTHEGEEAAILGAFAKARATGHWQRLILAPRHPRRGDDIARLISETGLAQARRSRDEDPADHPVYLADTMGEMDLWYRLAQLSFIGGSLSDHGGHTPFEPARHGTAILHGPHLANFKAAYRALDDAGAARMVRDTEGLAAALSDLSDPGALREMSEAAPKALAPLITNNEDALFLALAEALDLPALTHPRDTVDTKDASP